MKNEWIYLSHLIHPGAPTYGGSQAFFDEADKQMIKGDSCNTRRWQMSNHMGTHIDAPRHFSIDGATLDHYPASFWVFTRPFVVILNQVKPGQILTVADVDLAAVPSNVTLLLIKTGFGDLRDQTIYWQNNPGLDSGFAGGLRKSFPDLRVIGFDFISVSSFTHRDIGRLSHKAFLDHSRPLLLLEDMDLSRINPNIQLKQVTVSPILVKDADAAPCTVLAEVIK